MRSTSLWTTIKKKLDEEFILVMFLGFCFAAGFLCYLLSLLLPVKVAYGIVCLLFGSLSLFSFLGASNFSRAGGSGFGNGFAMLFLFLLGVLFGVVAIAILFLCILA